MSETEIEINLFKQKSAQSCGFELWFLQRIAGNIFLTYVKYIFLPEIWTIFRNAI